METRIRGNRGPRTRSGHPWRPIPGFFNRLGCYQGQRSPPGHGILDICWPSVLAEEGGGGNAIWAYAPTPSHAKRGGCTGSVGRSCRGGGPADGDPGSQGQPGPRIGSPPERESRHVRPSGLSSVADLPSSLEQAMLEEGSLSFVPSSVLAPGGNVRASLVNRPSCRCSSRVGRL